MTEYELETDGTVTSVSTTGYSSSNSRSSQTSYDTIKSGKLIQAKVPNGTEETETKGAASYLKQSSRQRYEWGKRIRLILALVGILSIVAVIFVLSFYLPGESDDEVVIIVPPVLTFKSLEINSTSSLLKINNSLQETAITGYFSESLNSKEGRTIKKTNTSFVISGKTYTLSLSHEDSCWNVTWFGKAGKFFEDCFEASDTHWYGAAELYHQTWPLEKGSVKLSPFLSKDLLADKLRVTQGFGGVLEPYFLNSKGAAIYVERNVKLHVSINDNNNKKICIRADAKDYPSVPQAKNITLAYTICVGNNVLDVHSKMYKLFIDRPDGVPDIDMITKPVWSTWARYKKEISQAKVEQFVNEILKNNMTGSQIEIDDRYSISYGDMNFDNSKFPNPIEMIRKIHEKKFRVTVWVYPFANIGSHAISSGIEYWVKRRSNLPALIRWWNGVGALLDTTNPAATRWFISRLKSFQDKFKIDSFKFDAGEISYLPKDRKLNSTLSNPNYYSTNYVRMASSFRGLAECRVGYHSQKYPLFVRMIDRTSSWGSDNGLKSVISAALTFGILGYPFVLPDMVGGNAYQGVPEKELYVRWAQLSVFMPAIQFSIPPWDYDSETVALVLKALQIRYSLKMDFLRFTKEVSISGIPIVRPLWWIAPTDPIALKEDTQFLLGSKYLIAPVIEKGATKRRVYLPKGTWLEQFGKYKTVQSNGEYFTYSVTLKDVVYFKKAIK